jgi:hypothetical protein
MSEREKWIEVEGDKPKVEASQAFFVELRASLKNALDVTSDVSMQTAELLTENARLLAELEQVKKALGEIAHIASIQRVGGPRIDGSQQWTHPNFGKIDTLARAALREAKQ